MTSASQSAAVAEKQGPHATAFELHFCPSVSLISVVRRFVYDFYDRVLDDPDAVSRVALSTHELLENAVKYSLDGSTTLSITVDEEPAGAAGAPPGSSGKGAAAPAYIVSIRLFNKAGEKDIAALRVAFGEVEAYADPQQHYQAAMERSARSKDGSRLGIPRVRAEGEMTMSCTIDDASVCILAQTRVSARRSA